jgi:hypothetical protein
VHYHPSFLKHEDVHGDEADEVLDGEEEMRKSESSSIIHYLFHGNDRVMVFMTLRNGMKLVLCDGYHEIFRVANDTLNYLLVLVLILFALAAVAQYFKLLKYGLGVILIFVGCKMLLGLNDIEISTPVSLAVIIGILALSVILSMKLTKPSAPQLQPSEKEEKQDAEG